MMRPISLNTDPEKKHQPLTDLLLRARRSKRMAGGDKREETEAMRVVYARLGKLVGR